MKADLSGLIPADELRARDLHDPVYRRESERTRLANAVAIRVLEYRAEHGLSQAAFGRLIGMRQPHVARLEAADHEPSIATLTRLAAALGTGFTIDISADGASLRASA